jgi:hypothetical protein
MENVTARRIDVNVRHTLVVLDVVLQTHAQILALPMVPVRKVWNVFVMKDIVEIHVLKDALDVKVYVMTRNVFVHQESRERSARKSYVLILHAQVTDFVTQTRESAFVIIYIMEIPVRRNVHVRTIVVTTVDVLLWREQRTPRQIP